MTKKRLWEEVLEKHSSDMEFLWGNVETPRDIMVSPYMEEVREYVEQYCSTNNGLTEYGSWLYNCCQAAVNEYEELIRL